jgi:Cu/Ag efflux pump CusA
MARTRLLRRPAVLLGALLTTALIFEQSAGAAAGGPTLTVVTEGPGLSPQEIETAVTSPIESALTGLARVQGIRSASAGGRSIVWLTFEPGVDVFEERQRVSERLQLVRDRLPADVRPMLAPARKHGGPLLLVGVHLDGDSDSKEEPRAGAMQLRAVAEFIIRPRLLTLPGVANVTVTGGLRKQYQFIASPERLARLSVTVGGLIAAVEKETTAGVLPRSRPPRLKADDLEKIVIATRGGAPVYTRDVATLRVGGERRSDASVWFQDKKTARGGQAVMLAVHFQPSADERLDEKVKTLLAEIRPRLPPKLRIAQQTFQEGDIVVHLRSTSGDDLAAKVSLAQRAEKIALEAPEVEAIWRTTGPPEVAGDDQLTDGSLLRLRCKGPMEKARSRSRDEVVAELRHRLGELPGAAVMIGSTLDGAMEPLTFEGEGMLKLFGPDLDVLNSTAEKVASEMRKVPGVVDLHVQPSASAPQLQLKVDREKAARLEIGVSEIATAIEAATHGRVAGVVMEEGQRVEVVIKYGDKTEPTADELSKVQLAAPSGRMATLGDVARISLAAGPAVVHRENLQRRVAVSYNVAAKDREKTFREVERLKQSVSLPEGYFIEFLKTRRHTDRP